MIPVSKRVPALFGATLFLGTMGCNTARSVGVPGLAAPQTVAGIAYNPAAPLDASVSFLGGTTARSYTVAYKGANGERVPGLLTLPAAGRGRVPCVLLLHGLGGSKGNMILPAVALA